MTAPQRDDCRPRGSADALAQALRTIYPLHVPVAEQRRLAGRALGLVLQLGDRAPVRDRSVLPEAFEIALLEVGRIMGKTGKATVTEAKQHLRGFGAARVKLASKLGRLSKLRNTEVHDVTCVAELAELAGTMPVETETETPSDAQREAEPECEDFDLPVSEVVRDGVRPQLLTQALAKFKPEMREHLDNKFNELAEQFSGIYQERGIYNGFVQGRKAELDKLIAAHTAQLSINLDTRIGNFKQAAADGYASYVGIHGAGGNVRTSGVEAVQADQDPVATWIDGVSPGARFEFSAIDKMGLVTAKADAAVTGRDATSISQNEAVDGGREQLHARPSRHG